MSNSHDLPRALPARMGVDPKAILSLLDTIRKKNIGLHGLVILRHGHVIAEGYFEPYRKDYTHMLFSLSKSFTSTAVGFAVQEGLLSLKDKVVSFFPDILPSAPCANMEKMTVRDLLTMSSGHMDEPMPYGFTDDWAKAFLHSYVEVEPGTHFLYNTLGTYMLSAIITKVTGMPAGEYLRPRLFEPLGIEDWWWEACPKGFHTGGFGLNLRTGDIAKFGQFLLQKGMWDGKQLLNPEWIGEATSYQVKNFGEKDWGSGYGYQFWRCSAEGVFRGDGACGQLCIVAPEKDLVIAVTAGLSDMQEELDAFWDTLLPGVYDAPLAENAEDQQHLEQELSSLQMAPPCGDAYSDTACKVSGRVYELSSNEAGITKISFTFGNPSSVTLTAGEKSCTLPIGFGKWLEGKTWVTPEDCHSFGGIVFPRTACAGAWNGESFCWQLVYPTTPFTDDFKVSFDGNALTLDYFRKIPFAAPAAPLRIIGRQVDE